MATRTHLAAKDISQAILEITGEALRTGDFDAFAAVFHVPQHMATLAGPIYMETRDDMQRAFDETHCLFKAAGGVELRRNVTEARYVSDTKIESTHMAETWGKDGKLKGPYPVFSTIERVDGTWKVTRSEYVLEPECPQAVALSKADAAARDKTH